MYQKYRYGANNQDKKNKPRAGRLYLIVRLG